MCVWRGSCLVCVCVQCERVIMCGVCVRTRACVYSVCVCVYAGTVENVGWLHYL